MKQAHLPILLLSALLLVSCNGGSSESSSPVSESSSTSQGESKGSSSSKSSLSSESSEEESSTRSSSSKDTHGWNVDLSQFGKTFQQTLAGLISGKTTSYSNCLSEGAKAAAFPTESSSKFIPFYHAPEASQVASKSECNREHTWPKSRGGNLIETDPIIIRPTLTKDNSDRQNFFYGLGGTSKKEWDPASCGYEGARGESARIILYAATRYASKGLSLSNNPKDGTGLKTMGTLKTLLEWNNKYQPTDFEKTVNERYAKMGYARNPFVDCPDFANYIYDASGYRKSAYDGASAANADSKIKVPQYNTESMRFTSFAETQPSVQRSL